jgi:hypothetical protein
MNEQTKAIGREAGLVFIEDGVYGQRWYSGRCGLDTSEYEKLVELIVQECVAKTMEVGEQNREPIEPIWVANCIAHRIFKHFGVGS